MKAEPRRLVLVGAGHAHLPLIRRAAALVAAGHTVTLVTPGLFWYSGMLAGALGRRYLMEDLTIDPRTLMPPEYVVRGVLERIDLDAKVIHLIRGQRIPFDLLSLNLGSEVPVEELPGATEWATAVKPPERLMSLGVMLVRGLRQARTIVVVGGGLAAVEVALNLKAALDHHGKEVYLMVAAPELLPGQPPRAAALVALELRARGVGLALGSRIVRVEQHQVVNEAGDIFPADVCIAATGTRPPRLLASSGLAVDAQGGMLVDQHLRSISHPFVFGGGDCVTLQGRPLERVGVYAVRQAPVLAANIEATLRSGPLTRFRPQRKFLQIADLGEGVGLLLWYQVVLKGQWVLRLKTWIDRRFMRRSRQGGGGTKVGWVVLAGVLLLLVGLYLRPKPPTWADVATLIRSNYPEVSSIDTSELDRRLRDRVPPVLVDVRPVEEYDISHLPRARRADPFVEPAAALLALPRETVVVAYCSVGYRSADFVHRLQAHGFTRAVNLEGSIFRWAAEGRPLESAAGAVRKVHPYDQHWGQLLPPELRAGR